MQCVARLLAALLALATLGAPVGATAQPRAPLPDRQETATLAIGFAGPLSGPSGGVGKSMQNGVQLALAEANRRGLRIGGKSWQLRLIAQDDRADPATAEFVARSLVQQQVIAVVGHWTSGTSLAAAPVYHRAGVIQVTPSAMSRRLTAMSYPRIFRTIPNNESLGRLAAGYAVDKLETRTIVTIDDRMPFEIGRAHV